MPGFASQLCYHYFGFGTCSTLGVPQQLAPLEKLCQTGVAEACNDTLDLVLNRFRRNNLPLPFCRRRLYRSRSAGVAGPHDIQTAWIQRSSRDASHYPTSCLDMSSTQAAHTHGKGFCSTLTSPMIIQISFPLGPHMEVYGISTAQWEEV